MTTTTETMTAQVTSRDGTDIHYWTSGDGPPLVLVHGTTADHTRWQPLLPRLEPHATVHAMDRRGRGASGDADEYDVRREFEDIAAVIDAVAESSGSAVDAYGHSFGAYCLLGAATLTSNIRRLVAYEPPVNPGSGPFPPGFDDRLESMVAAGDREAALVTFLGEVVGMPDHELAAYQASPTWPARVAAMHTVPRELRSVLRPVVDLEHIAATITVPTLLPLGGDSPDWVVADVQALAAALRDAQVTVLEGQQHAADVLAPEAFAERVRSFLA